MSSQANEYGERVVSVIRSLLESGAIEPKQLAIALGDNSAAGVSAIVNEGRQPGAGRFIALLHGLDRARHTLALERMLALLPSRPAHRRHAPEADELDEYTWGMVKEAFALLDDLRRYDRDTKEGRIRRSQRDQRLHELVVKAKALRDSIDAVGMGIDRLNEPARQHARNGARLQLTGDQG